MDLRQWSIPVQAPAYPSKSAAALDHCARIDPSSVGSVQGFGGLLVLSRRTGLVRCVSSHLGTLLPIRPFRGGRVSLGGLLGETVAAALGEMVEGATAQGFVAERTLERDLVVRAYCGESEFVWEFERGVHIEEDDDRAFDLLLSEPSTPSDRAPGMPRVTRGDGDEEPGDELALARSFVLLFRRVTAYDRVFAYRFDENWNGQVIAEDAAQGHARFLGHWFPSSDIPARVRALYLREPLRLIHDVEAPDAPFEWALDAESALGEAYEHRPHKVDLVPFVCRGVTGVHGEYLRNMGVRATLSVAVFVRGALWGIVSGHHLTPRVIGPARRAAALAAAHRLGRSLEGLRSRTHLVRAARSRFLLGEIARATLGSAAGRPACGSGVFPGAPQGTGPDLSTEAIGVWDLDAGVELVERLWIHMRELLSLDGLLLREGGASIGLGLVPRASQVGRLTSALERNVQGNTWSTIRLSDDVKALDGGTPNAGTAAAHGVEHAEFAKGVEDLGDETEHRNANGNGNGNGFERGEPQAPSRAEGVVWMRSETRSSFEAFFFREGRLVSLSWGGDPREVREESTAEGGVRVRPRCSFDRWVAPPEWQSRPWDAEDLHDARLVVEILADALRRPTEPSPRGTPGSTLTLSRTGVARPGALDAGAPAR